MTKTLLAFRHVAFEDLGAFEAPLARAGYRIRYLEMGVDALAGVAQPDLLAILGGPIGATEDDLYPFLKDESDFIAARLGAGRPTLGICLGAQLMARALGARVYPGRAKEIGWLPLTLASDAGLLAPLEGQPVLHWHGDTFDLPPGAVRLASTPDCDNQAFSYGRNALAFQFHPEAQPPGFERWLIGHAAEIAATKNVSVAGLRAGMSQHGAQAMKKGDAVLHAWLKQLNDNPAAVPEVPHQV
jgi:GMP synthase (glutamine-hydrolysing)